MSGADLIALQENGQNREATRRSFPLRRDVEASRRISNELETIALQTSSLSKIKAALRCLSRLASSSAEPAIGRIADRLASMNIEHSDEWKSAALWSLTAIHRHNRAAASVIAARLIGIFGGSTSDAILVKVLKRFRTSNKSIASQG